MSTLATEAPPSSRTRQLLPTLGRDSAYILIGFPLAVVSFVVIVTGFNLGAGLLITLAGFPVLAATLYVARGFATIERRRIAIVLNRPQDADSRLPGVYRDLPRAPTLWRRLVAPMLDGQYWLDLVHAIIVFPIATITWSIAVTWWSLALTGSLYWAYDWALPRSSDYTDLPELLGLGDAATPRILLYSAFGIFALVTLPAIMRGCALVQAHLGNATLNGLGALRTRMDRLERDRQAAHDQTAAAVSAEAVALRRLERDIHDGPQQRLVRLAMDLGRAQQQLDSDPGAARATMTEAMAQTREALDELRALSRGIAPPVLADRGLAAALAALAGRATVPVDLNLSSLDQADRPAPAVEHTAYFVVAEALTNVAKHSQASQCRVTLARRDGRLSVSVSDDGVGGAHLAKGHGLAGLADRVRAAGGHLSVESPPGGPTTVSAELPCD